MDRKKKILLGILAIIVLGLAIWGFSKKNDVKSDEDISEVKELEKEDNKEEIKEDDEDNDNDEKVDESNDGILAMDKKILDFTLNNLDGETVKVSDYEGKIVLINFWATWCTFCDQEMPDLQKLEDENDDVVVLAVNVREDLDLVKEYIDNGGYNFEVVLDNDGKIAEKYLVSGFPSSYFVDKNGVFRGRVPSMITYEDMDMIIKDIREYQ